MSAWEVIEAGLTEYWGYAFEIEDENVSQPLVLVIARDHVIGGRTKPSSEAYVEAEDLARRIAKVLP